MVAKILLLAALISASVALNLQNEDDSKDFLKTKKNTIVIFLGSECGYSNRILNEFKKAELTLKGKNIDWVLVTCDQFGNKPTCQKYEVRSYPQIGAFVNGEWDGIMPGKRGKAADIIAYIGRVFKITP